MFSLIPELYAMAPAGGDQGGATGQLIMFGLIFLIFFVLVIRPQQKKAKQHQNMLAELQKGDQVVTSSGIHGTIVKYFDDQDYLTLEIADKVVVKLQKNQISSVLKAKNSKTSLPEKEKK